jgi:hypothetical protein
MTTNAVPTPMHQTRTRAHRVATTPWAPIKASVTASVSASVAASTAPVSLYSQFEQAVVPTQTPATPMAAAATTATTRFACYAPHKATRKRPVSDEGTYAFDARKQLHQEFRRAS